MKKLAIIAICGYSTLGFGMEVKKFATNVQNTELRELFQTWESVKKGRHDYGANATVLKDALELFDKSGVALRKYADCEEVNVFYTDRIMTGLASVYDVLAEIEKEEARKRARAEQTPPPPRRGLGGVNFDDIPLDAFDDI